MTDFIEIKDAYGDTHILNRNYIIHIRKHLSSYNEVGSNSVIEFGIGFMDCIYVKETIEELNEKYKLI